MPLVFLFREKRQPPSFPRRLALRLTHAPLTISSSKYSGLIDNIHVWRNWTSAFFFVHTLDGVTEKSALRRCPIYMDIMSPESTRFPIESKPQRYLRNVFFEEPLLGGLGRECHMCVWISPQSLLLDVPLTDPQRWLYCLANSRQRGAGRPRRMAFRSESRESNDDC